jgi:hypothetical protein
LLVAQKEEKNLRSRYLPLTPSLSPCGERIKERGDKGKGTKPKRASSIEDRVGVRNWLLEFIIL